MELTTEQYEEISRIFFPKDDYKIPFTSREEMTREWIGKRIMENNFPVSFPNEYYFRLYDYLREKGYSVSEPGELK